MTIEEAYELLDLPSNSDLSLVRKHFGELYNEYSMQIDNAPTPNLRQRYEQNLRLREEAFELITIGSKFDDTADLPNISESDFVPDQPEKVDHIVLETPEQLDLETSLALLGVKATDSFETIRSAYRQKKKNFKAGFTAQKNDVLRRAFKKELENLEAIWSVVEPWLLNKFETVEKKENEVQHREILGNEQEKKPVNYLLWIGLLLIAGLVAWVYFGSETEEDFSDVLKAADSFYIQEDFPKAKTKYEEALKLKPGDVNLVQRLRSTNRKLGINTPISTEYLSENSEKGDGEEKDLMKPVMTKGGEKKRKVYIPNLPIRRGLRPAAATNYWEGPWGFVDKNGEVIIPFIYQSVGEFKDKLAVVQLNKKYGFINTSGDAVIPIKYDYAEAFNQGLAMVSMNDKWGFIDFEGSEQIPISSKDALSFSEGLAAMKVDQKWGYVNTVGTTVIPFQYEICRSFKEGLAGVRKDGKWGYVNKQGELIIPYQYEWVRDFTIGKAEVRSDKTIWIDKSGKYLKDSEQF